MTKFLDLSNNNNVLDYNGIKNYMGVIHKATEGNYFSDKFFEDRITKIKAMGLKVGAYHFLDFNSSPEEQAQFFFNKIKSFKLDIIPILDVEIRTSLHVDNVVSRFVAQFKQLSGLDMIIYTGWYYARDNFTPQERQKYKWWIASYGISTLPPIEYCDIVAWQYTNNEQVSGIARPVDCSILMSDKILLGNYTVTPTKPTLNSDIVKEYDEAGTATVIVPTLNVRDQPSTTKGNVLTSYVKGEHFNYNHVIITKEYVWVRYVSYTGFTRYVAVKNNLTGERYANCV